MYVSALEMRWRRAQKIDAEAIRNNPKKHSEYYVPSQSRSDGGYMVELHFNKEGQLKSCKCSCPDFNREDLHELATPMLRDIRVCKHILAAALKASGKSGVVDRLVVDKKHTSTSVTYTITGPDAEVAVEVSNIFHNYHPAGYGTTLKVREAGKAVVWRSRSSD